MNARISAIVRRRNFGGSHLISFNEIVIDMEARNVSIRGKYIGLTRKEYDLLLYFITNKKKVISENALANHLRGDEMAGNFDFIYTDIKNLRKKILEAGGEDYIRSYMHLAINSLISEAERKKLKSNILFRYHRFCRFCMFFEKGLFSI